MDHAQIPDEKLPNTRLQHERELKGWSQEYVAKEIDTLAKNVSRWECGDKPIPFFRQKLCALFSKNAEELGFLDKESSNDNGAQEEKREATRTPQEESVAVRDPVSHDPSSNQSIQFCIPQSLVHSSSLIHITVSSSPPPVSLQECGERSVCVDEPAQNHAYFQQGATPLPVATSQLGAPVDRRDFLRETGHVAVGLLGAELLDRFLRALKKPSTINERTLSYFELRTEGYWRDRHSAALASSDLLSDVIELLQKVITLLEEPLFPSVRTRLCCIASGIAQLAGHLLFDMGEPARARNFHQVAITAAQEGSNQALEAVAWGRMSFTWTYSGNPLEALRCIQEARRLAMGSVNIAVRAYLAAVEAEIQAILSNRELCLKALDVAERIEDQQCPKEEMYWLHFDRSRLTGYQGSCFSRLYHPEDSRTHSFLDAARQALTDALTLLDPARIQRRPALLIDIAGIYVQQGDVDGAYGHAIQALSIMAQTKSQTVAKRLLTLRQELEPWKDTQYVKNLDQQMIPLIIPRGYRGMA